MCTTLFNHSTTVGASLSPLNFFGCSIFGALGCVPLLLLPLLPLLLLLAPIPDPDGGGLGLVENGFPPDTEPHMTKELLEARAVIFLRDVSAGTGK